MQTPPDIVCVALRNGLGNRIFQVLAGLAYAEKHKKVLCICRAFIHPGFRPHEQNLDGYLMRIFPDLKYIDTFSNYTTIQEKQYFKYDTLPRVPGNVLLIGYFQCPIYFPSRALVPVIRTASYPNTFFVHIRGGDYLEHQGEWGFNLVSYYKKCFDKLKSRQNVKYLVFSNDNKYADNMMKQFNVRYTISDKEDPVDSLIEMANCEGGICVNSTFGWLGGFFQGTKMGQIFMPSIWNNTRDCKGVYPSWATIIKAEPLVPQVPQIPQVTQVTQAPQVSDGLVTVTLGNCGLGNKIFKILAGLQYAEKYNKEFVIDKSVCNIVGPQLHTHNLESKLKKLFPDIRWIESMIGYNTTTIKEPNEYNTLKYITGNVVLDGYFHNEKYFPISSKIPNIRTSYYPNTYFVHIRAGDYLNDRIMGYDKTIYYSNCFNILPADTKYIVFSDDNLYAENYIKQFNVQYSISNKICPLDVLVEMANCAGGICANSTLSWLGAFFQGDKRGNTYMPSIWYKGMPVSTGYYSPWVNIVCCETKLNPIIKKGIAKYNGQNTYLLTDWQSSLKDPYNLIVQASSTSGGDLWMTFPIGMSWQYVKFFNNSPTWQIGPHDKLVLCAIMPITDIKRRPSGINRIQILNNLQKNNIHNTQLQGESYFSSLPSYKFIISPEGNGIDCHRHYEALLAGCIPIIEYNDKILEKYKGLPILYTKDYSEITSDYLEQKYKEMSENTYDFSRLFLSYYSNEQQEEIRKSGNFWIEKMCGPNIEWYKQNIVWVTIINNGYVDFTKNFIESMKRNNCVFPLVVYCTDNESMSALKGYTGITCINAMPFLKFKMTQSLSTWQTIDYKRLVFAKLDAIKYALSQYKNSYIGYIDMDIVMLKNPEITIMNTFKSNPNAVFVSQCDEPKRQCSNTQNCQHFCSGVIVFKNLSIVNKLLDYNENDVMALTGDQHYLLNMANKYNVNHITVDKNIFLNGAYPGVNNNTLLELPSIAELIHYNYLIGENKVTFMKKNNMWYL